MSAHPTLPSEAVLKKDFVELGLSDVQADIVHKYLTQTLGLHTEEDTNNESSDTFRGNEVHRNSSIPMQVQFKRTNVQGHVDFGDSSEIRGLKFADEVYVNIHAWFIRKQCPLENPHLYFVRGLVVKVKTLEPRHHSRITIYFDSLDKAILKLHQYGMLSEVTTSEIDKSRQYLEVYIDVYSFSHSLM